MKTFNEELRELLSDWLGKDGWSDYYDEQIQAIHELIEKYYLAASEQHFLEEINR